MSAKLKGMQEMLSPRTEVGQYSGHKGDSVLRKRDPLHKVPDEFGVSRGPAEELPMFKGIFSQGNPKVCRDFSRGSCTNPMCPMVHELAQTPYCPSLYSTGSCEGQHGSCKYSHQPFREEREIEEFISANLQYLAKVFRAKKSSPLGYYFAQYFNNLRYSDPFQHQNLRLPVLKQQPSKVPPSQLLTQYNNLMATGFYASQAGQNQNHQSNSLMGTPHHPGMGSFSNNKPQPQAFDGGRLQSRPSNGHPNMVQPSNSTTATQSVSRQAIGGQSVMFSPLKGSNSHMYGKDQHTLPSALMMVTPTKGTGTGLNSQGAESLLNSLKASTFYSPKSGGSGMKAPQPLQQQPSGGLLHHSGHGLAGSASILESSVTREGAKATIAPPTGGYTQGLLSLLSEHQNPISLIHDLAPPTRLSLDPRVPADYAPQALPSKAHDNFVSRGRDLSFPTGHSEQKRTADRYNRYMNEEKPSHNNNFYGYGAAPKSQFAPAYSGSMVFDADISEPNIGRRDRVQKHESRVAAIFSRQRAAAKPTSAELESKRVKLAERVERVRVLTFAANSNQDHID